MHLILLVSLALTFASHGYSDTKDTDNKKRSLVFISSSSPELTSCIARSTSRFQTQYNGPSGDGRAWRICQHDRLIESWPSRPCAPRRYCLSQEDTSFRQRTSSRKSCSRCWPWRLWNLRFERRSQQSDLSLFPASRRINRHLRTIFHGCFTRRGRRR